MTSSKRRTSSEKTRQQLRGEALRERVDAVIRELAEKAQKAGVQYIYNASETARMVPTTRKSLAKHEELVSRVLQDLDARRRMATGEATTEHLRDQVAYLKDQIASRDKMIAALRAHHIDIYKRFHQHSLDAELLIRPILEKEGEEAGSCTLCGSKMDASEKPKQKSNVLPMRRRKSAAASK